MKPIINQSETPVVLNELKSKKDKEKQPGKEKAKAVGGVVDLILIPPKHNGLTKKAKCPLFG